jgi:hypothetical protein
MRWKLTGVADVAALLASVYTQIHAWRTITFRTGLFRGGEIRRLHRCGFAHQATDSRLICVSVAALDGRSLLGESSEAPPALAGLRTKIFETESPPP